METQLSGPRTPDSAGLSQKHHPAGRRGARAGERPAPQGAGLLCARSQPGEQTRGPRSCWESEATQGCPQSQILFLSSNWRIRKAEYRWGVSWIFWTRPSKRTKLLFIDSSTKQMENTRLTRRGASIKTTKQTMANLEGQSRKTCVPRPRKGSN